MNANMNAKPSIINIFKGSNMFITDVSRRIEGIIKTNEPSNDNLITIEIKTMKSKKNSPKKIGLPKTLLNNDANNISK